MRLRGVVAAGALAATLLLAPAAPGATTVSVRIEGATQTLFEGPVSTDASWLDGGDGSGLHPCQGDDPQRPRPTATTALADAAVAGGFTWRGRWDADLQDFFVDAIGPDASREPTSYWGLLVNWSYAAGGCTAAVAPGDEVLWAYDITRRELVLRLRGPSGAAVGEQISVSVEDGWLRADGSSGGPVRGARVGGAVTGSDGQARLRFDSPGWKLLKAERDDAIRSNALLVCVGDESCAGTSPAEPPWGGSLPPPAPGPEPGQAAGGHCAAQRRGTRRADRLRGTARGDRLLGGLGDDLLLGLAGTDCLAGGRGDDGLAGGPGRDRLEGGPGDDRLRAADGRRDNVLCGSGSDGAVVDAFDRVRGCERLRRR